MDSAGREEEAVSIEGGLAKPDTDAGQNEGRIFVPRKRTEYWKLGSGELSPDRWIELKVSDR